MSPEKQQPPEQYHSLSAKWEWPSTEDIQKPFPLLDTCEQAMADPTFACPTYEELLRGEVGSFATVFPTFGELTAAVHTYLQAFGVRPADRVGLESDEAPKTREKILFNSLRGFDSQVYCTGISDRVQRNKHRPTPQEQAQDANYHLQTADRAIRTYLSDLRKATPKSPRREGLGALDFLNDCPFYEDMLRGEIVEPGLVRKVDLTFDPTSDNRVVYVYDHDLERQYMLAATGGLPKLATMMQWLGVQFEVQQVHESRTRPLRPSSVIFDVDGVLRDSNQDTDKVREQVFRRLNDAGMPYGIWTRNGAGILYSEGIEETKKDLQTKGGDFQPQFAVNFDNWPFALHKNIPHPFPLNSLEQEVAQLVAFCEKLDVNPKRNAWLEAKIGRVLGHTQEHTGLAQELSNAVLIDDRFEALVAGVIFGQSTILLDDVKNLPDIAHMIGV